MRPLLRGELWFPRLFNVINDQIRVRALHSQMLVREFENGTIRGALIRIGNSVRDIDIIRVLFLHGSRTTSECLTCPDDRST